MPTWRLWPCFCSRTDRSWPDSSPRSLSPLGLAAYMLWKVRHAFGRSSWQYTARKRKPTEGCAPPLTTSPPSSAAPNPAELIRRQQSDFLAVEDHRGHVLDFHSLRHTCGSWLAISGAHPKTVQSVLRHSTITLTMDTYGHLLPGAEAEAADRLGAMVSLRNESDDDREISLKMTGTDAGSAQRQAQQLGRECERSLATGSESKTSKQTEHEFHNSFPALTLGDEAPCVAAICESSPGRDRTCDQGIMSPLL